MLWTGASRPAAAPGPSCSERHTSSADSVCCSTNFKVDIQKRSVASGKIRVTCRVHACGKICVPSGISKLSPMESPCLPSAAAGHCLHSPHPPIAKTAAKNDGRGHGSQSSNCNGQQLASPLHLHHRTCARDSITQTEYKRTIQGYESYIGI